MRRLARARGPTRRLLRPPAVAPVVNRPARHTEVLGNLSDRTARFDQIHNLAPELGGITPWHDDLPGAHEPEEHPVKFGQGPR